MTGTRASEVIFINESFYADSISPAKMDILLSRAWRHFGNHFYRYNLSLYDIYDDDIRRVLPLRVRLEDFSFSKSQRRTLRRNSDLRCEIRPIQITDESNDLFDRHRVRFKHSVPDSIYCFLSSDILLSLVGTRNRTDTRKRTRGLRRKPPRCHQLL
ncbi:MAG: hypothetical protein DYH05_02905 [Acidobacteria bacterium ACB1]|nr:hypothetical protein [Acidobacteria bacterium ACB1]